MKKVFVLLIVSLFALNLQAQNKVVVSKSDFTLIVISEKGDTLYNCGISYGRNPGNKTKVGDCKTPEGMFKIINIHDSSAWAHDFGDGKGLIQKAYGPYFFRLGVPGFRGIGIHGTCFPESIGTMATEGCIRCKNEDIMNLVKHMPIGTEVTILPDTKRE